MSAMYSVVGTSTPDYLLSDPQGAKVIAVPLTMSKGTVERGTVLVRAEAGTWEAAKDTDIDGTKQVAILNETVDTSASTTANEDAPAYVAGRFVGSRLKLASGTITEAIKVTLRNQGIYLDQYQA